MHIPYKAFIAIAVSSLTHLSCASTTTLMDPQNDPCSQPNEDCLTRYFCTSDQCNAIFDPGTPPNPEIVSALDACKDGAQARLLACDNDANALELVNLWFEYLDDIKRCREQYGEGGDNPSEPDLAECYEAVLALFQQRVNNLLGDNSCNPETIPVSGNDIVSIMPMQSIEQASFALGLDGKYPVKANSTLAISAGMSSTPNQVYDIKQIHCIKRAALIAVYQTKNGTTAELIDADMDTSDGVDFEYHLIGTQLVNAVNIELIAVYFDDNNSPQMAEMGILKVEDSPITGD
tara:strand:- start:384 stop:1256 length:873 start_codon:yes stop_codon:yes gene_type:complete